MDGLLRVPGDLDAEHADFSRAVAFVDGEYCALADAKISVRDFGLTHADATYDVLHTWKGGFFRLDDHLDRFAASCRGMRLDPGHSRDEIVAILEELVRRTGLRDTLVSFYCTRGAPPFGSRDPAKARNVFFAHVQPLVLRGTPEEMRRGLAMRISPDVHRIPVDSVDPRLKNLHWGDFTRALFVAREQGFDTVVLTDADGRVAEGPGFNVMALVDGELIAPEAGALEGVSCRTMIELAGELGIAARYGVLAADALRDAEEAFITSTSCGLFPVTRIDGRILGNGAPGPVASRLLDLYYRKKDAGWNITPVRGL
ncbi:MAG: aminotransferase class IV [Acetobacteraceae bacterium]|nr:aminotransferase class IV [Acetobacteraceae bacterium]